MKLRTVIPLLLILAACKNVDAYVITGQALVDAGEQFLALNDKMQALHATGKVDDATMHEWQQFAFKFQAAYPAAAQLWQVAVVTNDAIMEQKAVEAIQSLLGPLAKFASEVQVLLQQGSK